MASFLFLTAKLMDGVGKKRYNSKKLVRSKRIKNVVNRLN